MRGKNAELIEHRRQWIENLGRAFLALEKDFPFLLPEDPKQPEWVNNVERAITADLFQTKEPIELFTTKKLGSFFGHQCANAVMLKEWFELPLESLNSIKLPPLSDEETEAASERFDRWYDSLRKFAKKALATSVDQDFETMSDFLVGFSTSFAKKPTNPLKPQVGGTSLEIYLILFVGWRHIIRLSSVRQLHEALRMVLGQRVGDLKRIEKLCQRIGLTFRKPGRPKTKIIQTPQ